MSDCYSSFQAPILQLSPHPPTHSNTLVVRYFKEFVKLQRKSITPKVEIELGLYI